MTKTNQFGHYRIINEKESNTPSENNSWWFSEDISKWHGSFRDKERQRAYDRERAKIRKHG